MHQNWMENTNSVCLKMCMILEFGPLLEIKKKCTHKDNHFAKKRHENLMKNKKVQILLVPFSLVYL